MNPQPSGLLDDTPTNRATLAKDKHNINFEKSKGKAVNNKVISSQKYNLGLGLKWWELMRIRKKRASEAKFTSSSDVVTTLTDVESSASNLYLYYTKPFHKGLHNFRGARRRMTIESF